MWGYPERPVFVYVTAFFAVDPVSGLPYVAACYSDFELYQHPLLVLR